MLETAYVSNSGRQQQQGANNRGECNNRMADTNSREARKVGNTTEEGMPTAVGELKPQQRLQER
jgi:hypothetical protein